MVDEYIYKVLDLKDKLIGRARTADTSKKLTVGSAIAGILGLIFIGLGSLPDPEVEPYEAIDVEPVEVTDISEGESND